jgi:hypothetical protein
MKTIYRPSGVYREEISHGDLLALLKEAFEEGFAAGSFTQEGRMESSWRRSKTFRSHKNRTRPSSENSIRQIAEKRGSALKRLADG